jgi:MinD-like ATPase involved in chromosome partitioning or flagellar assembly
MSMLALASAKGAPGVTTAAVALGAVWPRRALLVEGDPAGGDLAARFHLPPEPNLVSLGMVARRGPLAPGDVWSHVQRLPRGLEVVTGLRAGDQARGLGRLWSLLPAALAQVDDADVLVDCGRLGPETPAEGLVRQADLVVLVTRPTVEGVLHVASRLEALRRLGVAGDVVLVGEQPFGPAGVRDALAGEGVMAPVRGVLAADPRGAAMLAGHPGRERWLERASPLVRSARSLAADLLDVLTLAPDRQGTWA